MKFKTKTEVLDLYKCKKWSTAVSRHLALFRDDKELHKRGKRCHTMTHKNQYKSLRVLRDIGESDLSYRVSQSQWAGGKHKNIVELSSAPDCHGRSIKVWSGNGKWSGNNSEFLFKVTQRCVNLLRGKIVIGGLVTLDAVKTNNYRILKISWAEQSKGFSLKKADGYLVDGHYHVTAKNAEQALKKFESNQKKTEKKTIIKHFLNNFAELSPMLPKIWVGVADSINAGNCRVGTDAFYNVIKQKAGQIGGLRADYLVNIRDDTFVRKAIVYAYVARYQ